MDWVWDSAPLRDSFNTAVTEVFSTITSPVFSELVVVLSGRAVELTRLPNQEVFFQTLRKMNEVRPFELVFLFEGPCSVLRGGRWELDARGPLEEALGYVASKGFLDFLDSPPTICILPQSRYYRWNYSHFD